MRCDKGEETLQRVFNPTDARYEGATGRLDGHKVQSGLCATQSLAAENVLRGSKPTLGEREPEPREGGDKVGTRS